MQDKEEKTNMNIVYLIFLSNMPGEERGMFSGNTVDAG